MLIDLSTIKNGLGFTGCRPCVTYINRNYLWSYKSYVIHKFVGYSKDATLKITKQIFLIKSKIKNMSGIWKTLKTINFT